MHHSGIYSLSCQSSNANWPITTKALKHVNLPLLIGLSAHDLCSVNYEHAHRTQVLTGFVAEGRCLGGLFEDAAANSDILFDSDFLLCSKQICVILLIVITIIEIVIQALFATSQHYI